MYRVTTPTHTFKLPVDTSEFAEIQVTYKQGGVTLIKHYQDGTLPSGMTLNEKYVVILLTQEETKQFKSGLVNVQLRALTNSGRAFASQMFKLAASEVLNEEILS